MWKNSKQVGFISNRVYQLFKGHSSIDLLDLASPFPLAQRQRSTFKSNVNIDKLYPASNPDILRTKHSRSSHIVENTTDLQESKDDVEKFSGYIPVDELEITTTKSSGPGGQNVNKVNSKVEIRFHLQTASWIPDWIKPRLAEKERTRINKDGMVIVRSDMTRKAMLNQADCLNKLRNMIHSSSIMPSPPTEEEIRLKERRMAKAKEQVLREKRNRSLLKKSRSI